MSLNRDEIITRGVEAALKLAEMRAWDEITLQAIAAVAELEMVDFHGVADRADLSASVESVLDRAMSEGSFDESETARTRLFDVIMMRFEAMEDQRDGVLSYFRWRNRSLPGLTSRVKGRAETAKWALAFSGLDTQDGIARAATLAGLAWAISVAERAWRQETSSDLTRTMAALDAELVKMEERAALLKRRRKRAEPDLEEDSG